MAATRSPIGSAEFVGRLTKAGVEESVARFVWDEVQPYYFEPLTPYPKDRLIGEMRIDSDDLSAMVLKFEKEFGRKWVGEWVGPDDPTLEEFARGLTASTTSE